MKKIICWGTGKIANEVMQHAHITQNDEIMGFIDNNEKKQGGFFYGIKVYSPQILIDNTFTYDLIIIMTDYYDEVIEQIKRLPLEREPVIETYNYFYKQSIFRRYEESVDEEIVEILGNIRKNGLHIYNYDFTEKYCQYEVVPEFDSDCGMYYIRQGDKQIYFAKYLDSEQKVKKYYRNMLMEQDTASPHRYFMDNVCVSKGDVVVDAGVAEGNFSIEIIDVVSKLYLIEADARWIEALKQTFKNYLHKVVFIEKFLSAYDEDVFVKLDSIVKEPIDFIKMDIEGYECDALLGAKNVFEISDNIKCAICSYHNDYDELVIKSILNGYGMNCSTSKGYMWFPYLCRKNFVSSKLCRGIVRAIK